MTSTQGWIKMSARKPTEADLPVWVYGSEFERIQFYRDSLPNQDKRFTHWQPGQAPLPPKNELNPDYVEYSRLMESPEGRRILNEYDWQGLWRLALAYRDKQNAADLANSVRIEHTDDRDGRITLNSLRRRCGIDQ